MSRLTNRLALSLVTVSLMSLVAGRAGAQHEATAAECLPDTQLADVDWREHCVPPDRDRSTQPERGFLPRGQVG